MVDRFPAILRPSNVLWNKTLSPPGTVKFTEKRPSPVDAGQVPDTAIKKGKAIGWR
jgi:hypothetical protein